MKNASMPHESKSRLLATLGMTVLSSLPIAIAALSFLAPPSSAQVTAQRLLDAGKEPQNWLMYSGDYAGRRYSTLEQINSENAASLAPKWAYQTMGGGKFE